MNLCIISVFTSKILNTKEPIFSGTIAYIDNHIWAIFLGRHQHHHNTFIHHKSNLTIASPRIKSESFRQTNKTTLENVYLSSLCVLHQKILTQKLSSNICTILRILRNKSGLSNTNLIILKCWYPQ